MTHVLPTETTNVLTDQFIEEFMQTGNMDMLDEGLFDLFRRGATTAVGYARRMAGGSARPRQIGARAELMPGPRLLGPGREPALLSGQVATSKIPGSAHADSRLLPAVSAKTGPEHHPILKTLHDNGYQPQGEYTHPEGGHFSVWMQHGRDRRGNFRSYPHEEGGQFHLEHGETGHPNENWHYFHPPESHSWGRRNRDRFAMEPHEHAGLDHPENSADWNNHDAASLRSWHGDQPHHQLAGFIGDMQDLQPSDAHHGGRYMSSEESDLRDHGWSHSYDDNHATAEKYDFALNPKSIYSNDKYPDHEIHLAANGEWEHHIPNHNGPVTSSRDGDLSWHLKHGIKELLGPSSHNEHDEEEDFPDHEERYNPEEDED